MTDKMIYEVQALEVELDGALRKIVALLVAGKSPNEAAWWLCANHARFIVDHPNLYKDGAEAILAEMASKAGSPPKGSTWDQWFARVREGANRTQGESPF